VAGGALGPNPKPHQGSSKWGFLAAKAFAGGWAGYLHRTPPRDKRGGGGRGGGILRRGDGGFSWARESGAYGAREKKTNHGLTEKKNPSLAQGGAWPRQLGRGFPKQKSFRGGAPQEIAVSQQGAKAPIFSPAPADKKKKNQRELFPRCAGKGNFEKPALGGGGPGFFGRTNQKGRENIGGPPAS